MPYQNVLIYLSARWFSIFTLLASIFFQSAVFCQSALPAAMAHESNILELSGEATLTVIPDQLSFTIIVVSNDDIMSVAYRQVERQVSKILTLLTDFDLPDANIQAVDFSMTTLFDYQPQTKISGYSAQRTVSIILEDISDYGSIIEALSTAGNFRFEQVKLSSSNYSDLEQQALVAAYQNAADKAQAIANASGNTLLGLINFRESNVSISRPYRARAGSIKANTANISEGSISITKNIVAQFGFK
jgi:hypothetical protein